MSDIDNRKEGQEGRKLIELLEEYLMGVDWDVHPDDINVSPPDHEPGTILHRVAGMATVPGAPFLLECMLLRKTIHGREVSLMLEVTLVHTDRNLQLARGRGSDPQKACEDLLLHLEKEASLLARGARALEFLLLAKATHGAEHAAFDYFMG